MLIKKFYSYIAILALAISASTVQAETPAKAEYLYVIHSPTAQISTKDNLHYQLSLAPTGKEVFYFSDRPLRKVGHMPIETFLNGWTKGKDSFAVDAPNAAVAALSEAESSKNVDGFIVLKHPQYDSHNNILTFDFKRLQGKAVVKTLKDVSLFIDDDGCIGGPALCDL